MEKWNTGDEDHVGVIHLKTRPTDVRLTGRLDHAGQPGLPVFLHWFMILSSR